MAEVLPPMTLLELLKDLDNGAFSDYVYIGGRDDGWTVANMAHDWIPALRIYRVVPGKPVEAEVRSEFNVASKYVGIVFGWDRRVVKRLTQSEAEDPQLVFDEIRKARA